MKGRVMKRISEGFSEWISSGSGFQISSLSIRYGGNDVDRGP